jgi:8-oxo-dGTP pyrophosphatase MutT (NUDIX family)
MGTGDVWITPSGALDTGETAGQAARREIWEETGIEAAELSVYSDSDAPLHLGWRALRAAGAVLRR